MKTIRMPKELLEKWLAALRGGEYTQAQGALERDGGYCCLGLLQQVVSGDVSRFGDGAPMGLPPFEWVTDRGIEFLTQHGDKDNAPWLPTIEAYAQSANDDGKTFREIADAIEACAEGV